jgi:hypothetical protein
LGRDPYRAFDCGVGWIHLEGERKVQVDPERETGSFPGVEWKIIS